MRCGMMIHEKYPLLGMHYWALPVKKCILLKKMHWAPREVEIIAQCAPDMKRR
jgi:hypothetical protein